MVRPSHTGNVLSETLRDGLESAHDAHDGDLHPGRRFSSLSARLWEMRDLGDEHCA